MTTITGITPLPWNTDGRELTDARGAEIATLWTHSTVLTRENRDANAAYIVQAANAYPTLIQAIRAAVVDACSTDDEDATDLARHMTAIYDTLNAALAQCGEGI